MLTKSDILERVTNLADKAEEIQVSLKGVFMGSVVKQDLERLVGGLNSLEHDLEEEINS